MCVLDLEPVLAPLPLRIDGLWVDEFDDVGERLGLCVIDRSSMWLALFLDGAAVFFVGFVGFVGFVVFVPPLLFAVRFEFLGGCFDFFCWTGCLVVDGGWPSGCSKLSLLMPCATPCLILMVLSSLQVWPLGNVQTVLSNLWLWKYSRPVSVLIRIHRFDIVWKEDTDRRVDCGVVAMLSVSTILICHRYQGRHPGHLATCPQWPETGEGYGTTRYRYRTSMCY